MQDYLYDGAFEGLLSHVYATITNTERRPDLF